MSVTRAEVLHVAGLARLELESAEIDTLTQELNGILEHVTALQEADVQDVDAVGGATEWPAPLRIDARGADALKTEATALSPASEQGFFTVPRLAALDADAMGSSA